MSSLYEQIGGESLRSVITDFYGRMFTDPMICFLFAGKDKNTLAQKEWEYTVNLLGGYVKYTGRSLRTAHARSLILEGHFYRRVQILEETLRDHSVPMPVRDRWIEHTFKLQPQIKHAIMRRQLPKKFELFVGTPEQREHWKSSGIEATLKKIWDWVLLKSLQAADHTAPDVEHRVCVTSTKVGEELVGFQFDAAVRTLAELLEFLLDPLQVAAPVSRSTLRTLLIIMTSFAPRMTEHLWEVMNEPGLVYLQRYPTFELPVQAQRDGCEEMARMGSDERIVA
jgi:hemoglobin